MERNEQLLATVQSENKKLAEPLRKAKEQLVELQRQLGSQEKEKSALISAQSKLKSSQKKVENLSWEVEVLKQKYDRALRERDEIHERFSSAIIDMQQKSGLKYKILEKKIVTMREQLDVKDAQLHASTKSNQFSITFIDFLLVNLHHTLASGARSDHCSVSPSRKNGSTISLGVHHLVYLRKKAFVWFCKQVPFYM